MLKKSAKRKRVVRILMDTERTGYIGIATRDFSMRLINVLPISVTFDLDNRMAFEFRFRLNQLVAWGAKSNAIHMHEFADKMCFRASRALTKEYFTMLKQLREQRKEELLAEKRKNDAAKA